MQLGGLMTAGQRGTCIPVVIDERPIVPTPKTSRTLLQICSGFTTKIHMLGCWEVVGNTVREGSLWIIWGPPQKELWNSSPSDFLSSKGTSVSSMSSTWCYLLVGPYQRQSQWGLNPRLSLSKIIATWASFSVKRDGSAGKSVCLQAWEKRTNSWALFWSSDSHYGMHRCTCKPANIK